MSDYLPRLRSVTRDGDDIILCGGIPDISYYADRRVSRDDLSAITFGSLTGPDIWGLLEAAYQRLVEAPA